MTVREASCEQLHEVTPPRRFPKEPAGLLLLSSIRAHPYALARLCLPLWHVEFQNQAGVYCGVRCRPAHIPALKMTACSQRVFIDLPPTAEGRRKRPSSLGGYPLKVVFVYHSGIFGRRIWRNSTT